MTLNFDIYINYFYFTTNFNFRENVYFIILGVNIKYILYHYHHVVANLNNDYLD